MRLKTRFITLTALGLLVLVPFSGVLPAVAQTVQDPEVSIEAGASPVTEGANVTFTLTRTGATTAALTVNVSVTETGTMLGSTLPETATFVVGASKATLTVATEDDTATEDPSAVTATVTDDAAYQVKSDAAYAEVVVLDDTARFVLTVGPEEVREGGGGAVTVEVTNGVTFAANQTIALTITGTAAANDFTLFDVREQTLSSPYTVTLPAGESVAATYVTTVNDADEELAETIIVTVSHDGTAIGTQTMTIKASPLRLELSTLAVTGSGRAMYPAFDPGTLHYAAGCADTDPVTLTLSAKDANTRLAVNGIQRPNHDASVELTGLNGDSDILITLSNGDGASTTYVVHCMNANDPVIEVDKKAGSSAELLMTSVNESGTGHLLVIDANGVPRYHRRVKNPRINHFRTQVNDEYPYSYSTALPQKLPTVWGGRGNSEVHVLDPDFNEVTIVTTTDALKHTAQQDFLIKENGNYVLMAYEPAPRDLSEFTDPHGNPYRTNQPAEDSVIEEVTPGGTRVFVWNSFDHMYLGDCMVGSFPGDYAHINTMQLVDGDIVGSFRGCAQVLRIDGTTGNVEWILGRTKRSDAEWEALGVPPPLKIVGDPYGEFCAQHSAKLLPNGHLLLFDNGWECPLDPETGAPRRVVEEFSRVVEYALDLDKGQATFVRHHSLHGSFSMFTQYQGHVEVMDNKNWLLSWGFSPALKWSERGPDTSVTEYNPTTDQELLSVTLSDGTRARETRAYPLGFEALAKEAGALTAEVPASAHTSAFNRGATDTPQVVVSFSQPVADFIAATPSVSVQGATIASVSPHVVPGEPANAYVFTLTPAGVGPITFSLAANQPCASGGICTAGGDLLSEVPPSYVIVAPVTVSFMEETFTTIEGGEASVVVSLSAAHHRPLEVTIPIVVSAGGTALADEYSVPADVTFAAGETEKTVSVTTTRDTLIEGDETIELSFGDLPPGVTAGANPTTTATIKDDTASDIGFSIDDDEVSEGGGVELTFTIENPVTFADPQTINLFFHGSATEGVDFTVSDTQGRALSAPHALALPAGESSVTATINMVDDVVEEEAETIEVSATHGMVPLGAKSITILASDAPPTTINSAPEFTAGASATRSVAENTGPDIDIGTPLTATDANSGDTLAYTLGGTDVDSFNIVSTSGQLRTRSGVDYDYETKASYAVMVSVSDGDATDSINVEITLNDVAEPPDAPAPPDVSTASSSSLEVTWAEPLTPGRPSVRDYDLRYKTDAKLEFTDGPQNVIGTSATINGLVPGVSYEVQVRARNDEGDSGWSMPGRGSTEALPVVTLVLDPPSIPANGGLSTVTATVSPSSPTAFTVTVWAAAFPPVPDYFTISENTTLSFAANHTQSAGLVTITAIKQAVVNVTGTVSEGANVTPPARQRLTITAGAATNTAPDTPDRPTGQSTGEGTASLDWNDVPTATSYDVRVWQVDTWTELSADASVNGISITFNGSSAMVGGLPTDYEWYFFGVRAINAAGASGWSPNNAIAVPKDEPLTAPDTLDRPTGQSTGEGTASLDWNDVPTATSYDVRVWQVDTWTELSADASVNGISITFNGSSAMVGGLPTDYEWYFFEVRAINAAGASGWSPNNAIAVPKDEPLAADATLRGLTLSDVTLAFASATTEYTASVANDVTQTTATPTLSDDGATYTIKLGGVADDDGVIPLSVGSNVITVEVTAEDGKTTKTYTVTVTRAEQSSTDATLRSLALSGVPFTFASDTTSYDVNVANGVDQTTVTATANDDGASYVVKLGDAVDGDGTVELSVGSNVITIEVTAEDENATRTYTVTVTRAAPSVSGLAVAVELSPSGPVEEGAEVTVTMSFGGLERDSDPSDVDYIFRADVKTSANGNADGCEDQQGGYGLGVERYMRQVDEDPEVRTGSISASCAPGDYTVEVSVSSSGNVELASATAGFTVNAPAQQQQQLEPPSTDATLSGLTLSGVNFGAFNSATTRYTASVANGVDQTTVKATANDGGATYAVKLGGVADEDGTVELSVGSNAVSVVVTAEDGETTKTYTVTVTRADSPPPNPPEPVEPEEESTAERGAWLEQNPENQPFVGEWQHFTLRANGLDRVDLQVNVISITGAPSSTGAVGYGTASPLPAAGEVCGSAYYSGYQMSVDSTFSLVGCREGTVVIELLDPSDDYALLQRYTVTVDTGP